MLRLFRREKRLPRLAMVMTVRNEERFLETHLLYHRLLGVERVYLFLDRCFDQTEAIAAKYDWVKVIELDEASRENCEWNSLAQVLCMDKALEFAREEGIDWLLVCDPDEFCFGCDASSVAQLSSDVDERVKTASLVNMLAELPSRVEQVLLRPIEVLPIDIDEELALKRTQAFLTDFTLKREIFNPETQQTECYEGFIGYMCAKSIVRTAANVQAACSHYWTVDQQRMFPLTPGTAPLNTVRVGGLLHYVSTSYPHWLEKFQKFANEPAVFSGGGDVHCVKRCSKSAVRMLNEGELQEYYRRWIATPEQTLNQLIAKGKAFQTDIVPQLTHLAKDLYPASKSDLTKVHWNPVPNPRTEPEEIFSYHPEDLLGDRLRGFFRPTLTKRRKIFNWTQPSAGLKLQLPPDDYEVTIELHRVSKLCPQRIQAFLNHERLEQTSDKLGGKTHTLLVRVDQFSATGENWLWLKFTPDESAPAKQLTYRQGAPITEIRFEKRDSSSRRAA